MTVLPETARQIDTRVAQAQADGHTPSLVLGVVRDGTLAHVAVAGEHPRPDVDLQYRVGSISKTMTATLIMQLRDAGRLALDDRLEQHLPGTGVGELTVRQLLGHASGIQREPEGDWWERAAGVDLATVLAEVDADKIAYPPHRAYHYSNLAYGLLGGLLERLTGTPWADLLDERILTPLSLRRTTYAATEPYARGYVVHPWHGTLREEPRTDTGAMAPAGQLWSTIEDLGRWAAFLADPDPAVLAAETLTEMCAPVVISDLDSWTGGHGLGLELYRDGERVYVGHGGSMPGYVAALLVHRPTRTAVVGFANSYGFPITGLGRELLTTVLDAEPAFPQPWRPATAAPDAELAELTGRWWWMGTSLDLSWDAGDLVAHVRGERVSRFTAEGTDRWRGRSGPENGEILSVLRDDNGRAAAIDIATFVFTRSPDEVP
ncbi:serine hydrolase domain-containing protein [Micromonospora noduli]|uniref:Serine-type D-Ala-D-Ala carboxypeptidase n=1 Tax=Micromonospora noduli TaxID=709876 RepID=A0ABX9CZR1_9ACTN|nr:serine hydrolase domain-containing protein [Micromonospora noduli]KAB1912319.1 beta-lactamase family protein [Micromonospora noduli]RAO07764.1 Serine-type D-Ala-D-Ala carboxypeptidase [Micromonospora noduli]RAO15282.1 Serine-type D-Ala-D-Ala carboxypeptidase [Micromonospora noduli]RAO22066.1 Serine-type D-Ala-D-Ala carboxypeptidase [Micromonospora noduli]RAO30425.1 Serine-type D-Ala-D-Ala carboxypeptidase [Micromonospora noduli]